MIDRFQLDRIEKILGKIACGSGGALATDDPVIQLAEARILDSYGDQVSVSNKKKSLRKFGESTQVQTTDTTLMGNLTGIYEETYVERNLLTHIASSSAADTMVITVEGHTSGADVAVSSLNQAAGIATCNTSSAHGMVVGEWVNIEGAGEAGYNGVVQVLTVGAATTFTYEVDSATATPATGTITANSYNKSFSIQTVTLAGQTKTALATPLSRCNRMYVGSQNAAVDSVGDIYVSQDVTYTNGVPASGVACMITAGANQSTKAGTTISSSDYWLVKSFHAHNSEKTAGRLADVALQVRNPGGVFRVAEDLAVSAGNTVGIEFPEILVIPPNSDVRLVARASGAGHIVGGTVDGFLAN